MIFQSHLRLRRIASLLSTLSLVSYTTMLVPAQGQTPVPDKTDMPDKTGKNDPPPKKKVVLPPGNPAVFIDPNTGTGNATKEFNKDGTRRIKPEDRTDYGDHRLHANDPRMTVDPDDLPIYGYSYFDQARRSIELRRMRLERSLGGYDNNDNPRKKSTNSKDTSGRSNNNSKTTRDGYTRDDANPTTTKKRRNTNNDDTDSSSTGTNRNRNRNTTDDSDTSDDSDMPTSRRVRRGNNSDTGDPSDTTDNYDNSDTTSTRKRIRRTDNSDNTDSSDSTDNSDDNTDANNRRQARTADDASTAEALRAEDAIHEQNRRRLLGLPPLDNSSKSTRSRNSSDTSDDGSSYNSGSNSRNQNSRNGNNSNNNNYNSQDSDTYSNNSRYAPNAFDSIIDPLTQLTNNIIASAPTNYQLSGGDEVMIHISTPRLPPRDLTRRVDPTGSLDLDELGRYVVRGKTLDQLEKDLQQTIGTRFYKNAVVSISLNKLRTIGVTVQGEAVLQGPYAVPAIATAFNVLYAAGGPTKDGSMRDIKVMRQGKEVGTLDFYKFVSGKSQSDIPLQSGDVIVVAPNGSRVSILGEVRHPAQYEIKDGETLKDILTYSGGIKASGADQIVQLNTIEPGQNRVLKNVNLRDQTVVAGLRLYDGDSVEIHSLRQIVENKVTIKGAVTQPSDYALTPNMRISDLLRMARNPVSEAYLGRAALKRWNSDNTTTLIPIDLSKAIENDPKENVTLMKWDVLEIYTQEEANFVGTRQVFVKGSVQRPGKYEYSQNMHLSDVILKAGGAMQDAESIELIHQHGDHTFKYESVRVADITHGDKTKDLAIEDNDLVCVYSNRQAGYVPDHLVRIEGEVNTVGFYPRGEGMKLTDLLRVAGRFKPGANPRVVIAHARRVIDGPDSTNNIVSIQFNSNQQCAPQDDVRLEDGDVVAVQGTGGIEDRPAVVRIIGAVNNPGPIILKNKKQRLSDAIKEAGGLRSEAFPEGAEFNRDPKNLNTSTQRDLAGAVSTLNNLLNDSKFKSEQAKSDIERLKALNSANSDSSSPLGGAASGGNTVAGATGASELFKHDLVTAPRRLTDKELDPSGNIAINLPAALDEAKRGTNGVDDILLKDGDTIIVPEKPTTVQVIGAVTNQRGILFTPGKPLAYYIALAGDYTPDAAKDRIVVIHAGGGIIPAKDAKTLRPGDVILVPTKVLAQKISDNRNGFGDFFKSLTSSAILFKVATGIFGL